MSGTTDLTSSTALTTQSTSISFAEIPSDWRSPGNFVEVRPSYTNKGIAPYPTKVLIVGPKLAAAPGAFLTPVQITLSGQAAALFGQGGPLSDQCEAFIANNKANSLWAMAVPDADGSVAASGKVVFGGAPTAAGTVPFYAAGQRVSTTVTTQDTPATIVPDLIAAINANTALPVVATANGSNTAEIDITVKQKGVLGNDIDLRTLFYADDALPPGLTATITPLANGAGVPDLTPAIAAIRSQWFTDIVTPFRDGANMAVLTQDLTRRYMAMGGQDMHAYAAMPGTYGQLSAASANWQNSPFLSPVGMNGSPTPPWCWAAALAGVASYYLTEDPSRQLRGLALAGILPPAEPDQFDPEEKDQLLRNAVSTWSVVAGQVVLDRVVTGYLLSAQGTPDDAWLDIMAAKTYSRIRYDWLNYLTTAYPRNKLAPDGSTAANFDTQGVVVTPRRMQNSWAGRCQLYAQQGWIQNEAATVAQSQFTINASDPNRLDAVMPIDRIGNLMVFAGALEFQV